MLNTSQYLKTHLLVKIIFHLVVSDLSVVLAQGFELCWELEATIGDAVKARCAAELLQRWVLDSNLFASQLAWVEESGLLES